MLRFLRYTGRGLFFFKRIKIGINLFRSSIKIVTFEHNKYFIFCLIITIVQLSRIFLFSYIDKATSKNFLINEFLFGQTFFETLLDYSIFPMTSNSLKVNILKVIFFYIGLNIIYFVNITTAFYAHNKNLTILECFKKSIKKLKLLHLWVIIDMIVLFITALLGFIGDVLQFIWQLSTALSIQIIAFEKVSVLKVLKHCFNYFKKIFGNILGIDLIIDATLVIFTILFYYFYQTKIVPTFNLITENEINIFMVVIIFYILSTINILEVITFTKLYDIFHHHPENLKK